MKCPNCHKEINEGFEFCPYCGSSITPVNTSSMPPVPPRDSRHVAPKPSMRPTGLNYQEPMIPGSQMQIIANEKRGGVHPMVWVGIGVGVFILITLGYLLLTGKIFEKGENIRYSNADYTEMNNDTAASSVQETQPEEIVVEDVNPVVSPVTQYALVDVSEYGPGLRDENHLKKILTNLGFSVSMSNYRPEDEMETYTILTAQRKGSNGGYTQITYKGGEDRVITIDFADSAERSAFVESMEKSNYRREGNRYYHAKNSDMKVGVKVIGDRVIIISPFEMLPSNF